MALVTHQMQGLYTTFPSRPFSWSKGIKLQQHVMTLHMVGRTEKFFSLKRNLRSSVGAGVHGPKVKVLKISAFKGSAKNNESGSRANGSKVSKNSAELSYVPNEAGESIMDSSKAHGIPDSYPSEGSGRLAGSPAIHELFKKWLNMLRAQSPNQVVHELLQGAPPSEELPLTVTEPQAQATFENERKGEILKAVGYHILEPGAAIKIPLLMFVPLYLAVNAIYGPQISKELTPLWILGPLIVGLNIKAFQGLVALYVFTFRQTREVIKNLPYHYQVVRGKLKEVRAGVSQTLENIKNTDYKALMQSILEWFADKQLDLLESIWPHYCRTIRFLKKAKLI